MLPRQADEGALSYEVPRNGTERADFSLVGQSELSRCPSCREV